MATDPSETWIERGAHRIYARTYPGAGPPLVLMHGFPDSLHLYDRLLPHLGSARQVVTFDFLAGVRRTSRAATPTPPPTRPATSTP